MQRLQHGNVSRGFTLIEVLVGLVIGMIGLLVIYKTVTLFDARTRSSTAGGDAQVAGTLATYALERDLQLAGMGFSRAPTGDMGCTVFGHETTAGDISFRLMPIEIIDGDPTGTTGASDEVRVLYGNSPFFPLEQTYTASTSTTKKMVSRNGFKTGDLAVVTDGSGASPGTSNCALVQITDNTDPDGLTLSHLAGSYPNYYAASAPTAAKYNDSAASTAFSAGNMYSLGPTPQRDVWTVVGDTLHSSDTLHGTTADYAEGIVNMKVFYGIDGVDASLPDKQIANAEWTKTPPATTDWKNVLAVRVALLVRSRDFVKPAAGVDDASYTAVNPTYTGAGGVVVPFVMTNLDGNPDSSVVGSPNNWRYYRYRVYERVIPLRNMLW